MRLCYFKTTTSALKSQAKNATHNKVLSIGTVDCGLGILANGRSLPAIRNLEMELGTREAWLYLTRDCMCAYHAVDAQIIDMLNLD